jgi:hypothetical protein
MLPPRIEEGDHIGQGQILIPVEVNGARVYCLCRKKDRSLLWTADVNEARKAGLPEGNKGDFLGWVPNSLVRFLPCDP